MPQWKDQDRESRAIRMVMRVIETVRKDKVKRVISSAMYRNAERDRGKKIRRINSAIKKRGDKGKVSLNTAG
ncbi:Branched-chain-amino-acid aminotransferase [Aphis craccivora]|uniref:Branched-chain-amino-acid aminotransferase n=1 Tax=Aphis craccivora TaxID=307492 RepID=A0A6G0YV47_APHCR|nr:Branched-chain-amino-acid aminotransferase [Aphis craccivora]